MSDAQKSAVSVCVNPTTLDAIIEGRCRHVTLTVEDCANAGLDRGSIVCVHDGGVEGERYEALAILDFSTKIAVEPPTLAFTLRVVGTVIPSAIYRRMTEAGVA